MRCQIWRNTNGLRDQGRCLQYYPFSALLLIWVCRMNIAIVVVTHNRLEYTKKTLARLLEDPTEEFDLYLWDNASTDETPEYLRYGVKDPRIVDVALSNENVGQGAAMNHGWGKTKAELVGKIDNDCLQTPGWTRTFAQAHADIPQLGVIAAWHFFQEDFDYEIARHKIQRFNGHQVFRHPWVGGSGFVMKRKTFLEHGSWKVGPDVGTTVYFVKMALSGYINGWYYPLIHQEHMDDPVSKHSMLKDDAAVNSLYDITYGLRNREIRTLAKRMAWREQVLHDLLYEPWDAKYYVGWRSKLRTLKTKLRSLCSTE